MAPKVLGESFVTGRRPMLLCQKAKQSQPDPQSWVSLLRFAVWSVPQAGVWTCGAEVASRW